MSFTHYLHYKDKILADIETSSDDLSVLINIDTYSYFLLANLDRKDKIVIDFYQLQELRGSFFERVSPPVFSPFEVVSSHLEFLVKEYNLSYTTD